MKLYTPIEVRVILQGVYAKAKKISDFGTCDSDYDEFDKWLVKKGLGEFTMEEAEKNLLSGGGEDDCKAKNV